MRKTSLIVLSSFLGASLALTLFIYFYNHNKTYVYLDNPQNQNTTYTSFNNNTNVNENFVLASEKSVDAVVHVKKVTLDKEQKSIFDFFYGNSFINPQIGNGSGVIISPDGLIVTNNHVIENATQIEITLNNNKIYQADILGQDATTDIALLKIETKEKLPFLTFGNSDNVKIGEWVLAIGNPFNLTSTVTAGIISAKARDLNSQDNKNQSFIQTDAAVNSGNSGGALINTKGQLIGINTAISSQTGSYIGYSFAVPSNIVKKVFEDLMEYGNVQKGILGVKGNALNSIIAEQLGTTESQGFFIQSVEKNSGAEIAKIKTGDIIKKIDNIEIKKFADMSGHLSSKRPGNVVYITILRDKKIKVIPVKLIKNETYTIPEIGVTVKNLTKNDKVNYDIDNGVKIVNVSPVMKRYNLENKVIIELNHQRINTVDDIKTALNKNIYYGQKNIVIINEKGETERFVFQ